MSTSEPTKIRPAAAGATYAVAVLTAMNLLNYLDRYVPSAVKDLFKNELHLDDAQTSWPLSAFIIVYMLASPVFGSLADRWPRKVLIAIGVAIWSLATGAAAFAQGFWTLVIARALVGVGEAAYATIAPSLISDFYPPERRNRILTLFYVAIPVGSAIGFTLGGVLGQHFGWRAAFLMCGLPGLIAAALALRIQDPGKGHFEGEQEAAPDWVTAFKALMANKQYVVAVAGYTAVTFASGGMADWLPTYLSRIRGMELGAAGSMVGTVTVIGGLGGTIIGGLLADRLEGKTRQHYLALSTVSMVPAAILAALSFIVPSTTAAIACIGFAQFFMWCYNGPINTVIANAVPGAMRARAFALSILSIHILGDAISPPIIGYISDTSGSLPLAVSIVPIALGIGALIWGIGWRRL